MRSKTQIKKQILRSAAKLWSVKSIDSLDPIVKLMLEAFATLAYDNENSIADIKERLLEQVASSLVPDHMLAATPAHSIMQVEPIEPKLKIDRQTLFYTNHLTQEALRYNLKTLNFVPVINHIELVKGQVNYLLGERNLYEVNESEDKKLLTKATSFYQELNHTLWIGFDLDKQITSLKNIHFYIDFPTTESQYELYDLLRCTHWYIDGQELAMRSGLPQKNEQKKVSQESILAHYDIMKANDEEVMNIYYKQFFHIQNQIPTSKLQKTAFPPELRPFFPDRVNTLEPQYWIKVIFPSYFKGEDFEDITIQMNCVPVSNKNLITSNLYRNRSLTGILPLPVTAGEYYLSVEKVEDSYGNNFDFLPYNISQTAMAGTYTVKRGGLERFSSRDLADNLELFKDLIRTEYATFYSFGMRNLDQAIGSMEQIIKGIKDRLKANNATNPETPTYLLLEPDEDKKNNDVSATYWTTNCDLANGIPYGTLFSPTTTIPVANNACKLLKSTSGARVVPQKDELLTAFKYALSTRDQLFSAHDVEMFCYLKFPYRVEHIKVQRGIASSDRPKEGLVRTVDVIITPTKENREWFDAITLGMLKTELEKRSPQMNRYRIILDNSLNEIDEDR